MIVVQEFILEIIRDASFYRQIRTKKGIKKRFIYKEESSFFKLQAKTIKALQKKIDMVLKKHNGLVVDWKIYTSFPFE